MACNKKSYPCFITLLILCLMLFSSGCKLQGGTGDRGKNNGQTKGIKIGLSMDTLLVERWQRDRDILVARIKELGADVIVQNANNDSTEQMNQIKFLLEQKIDVLIIIPHDSDLASAAVQMAKKYGVKVISYDRLVRNANVDLYISFDNVKVGELMADQVIKTVPKGNYVIINGSKTDYNSFMFNSGYKKGLKENIEKGQINILKEIWAYDWRPEEAFKCIEEILQEGKRVDAIIAGNDSLAGAAIEALSEKRLAGKVVVVGHDADLDGCQRVVEGTQLMTVYKPIDRIAKTAAEIAVKMAKGEKVEINGSIYDGKGEVPYYIIQPVPVTKQNMVETVINEGFHRIDEIYRNVPKAQWPEN